jgi:hypothetical protein
MSQVGKKDNKNIDKRLTDVSLYYLSVSPIYGGGSFKKIARLRQARRLLIVPFKKTLLSIPILEAHPDFALHRFTLRVIRSNLYTNFNVPLGQEI